jgi:hypothetical protein
MDRRQVEHVEAERGDLVQALVHVGEGAVLARRAARAREELVPRC